MRAWGRLDLPHAGQFVNIFEKGRGLEQGWRACGTDHRLSWSVTQGLRPAKFHENLRRQEAVNLRSIFAFPSSLVFKGLRCFFDLVIPR